MKVILLQDVRNVGRKLEVKEVSDGFASNFLLPRKLAQIASDAALARIEAEKKQAQALAAEEERKLGEAVDALRGKRVTLTARATDKGGLFKAVDAKVLAARIKEEFGIALPSEHIAELHLKTVGEHQVAIFSKNRKAEVTVVISAGK